MIIFLKFWCITVCVLQAVITNGQHKWDGEGGDGEWINPLNWSTNTLPGAGDDVILDNSIVAGSYMVMFPAGPVSVSIKRLIVDPAATDSIYVILPKQNIAVPALQISSSGYGLTLNNRSVFINASGAGSGLPVMISDSIRINNGGRYVHRTTRSHAANITVLATTPGTEAGIFEFDIPEASGTISLSDRVFGTLILSATTAMRTVNYTAAGTRGIRVRSNFILNAGVALNLNFSDTFRIQGNFIQYASTFNCGTTARNLIILIQGNLFQFSGGVISESGTGLPELIFDGPLLHQIRIEGSILNSISVTMASADCMLQTSLRLPYSLRLLKGRLHTTDSTLLILGAGCSISADSAAGLSFVNGPMIKEGLLNEYFLFPVGKGTMMRWFALKNVTGTVRVEFMKSNPQLISALLGQGIHHISSIEYWKVSDHLLTGGNVELSFDNVNSGGVTELSSLRVAVFDEGKWHNAGNSLTTGNAGGAGSVVSDHLEEMGSGDRYFTLAAATSSQNPLPFLRIDVNGVVENGFALLRWTIQSEVSPEFFEIKGSTDGINFFSRGKVQYAGGTSYIFRDTNNRYQYCRLYTYFDDRVHLSEIIPLKSKREVIVHVFPTLVREYLIVKVIGQPGHVVSEAQIISTSGAIVRTVQIAGNNENYKISTSNLQPGMYFLILMGKAIRFVKL